MSEARSIMQIIHCQTRGKPPHWSSNGMIRHNNRSRSRFPKTPNIVFMLLDTMLTGQ